MSKPFPSLGSISWLLAGMFALCLPACRTISTTANATAETPFVVSFDFKAPINATLAERTRFAEALDKYSVPDQSSIQVDGTQIWPPPSPNLKTENVITNGARDGEEASVVKTQGRPAFTHGAHMAKDTRGKSARARLAVHTRVNPDSIVRARSTQLIAFKSEKDMRAFLRVIAGK